MKIHDLDTLGAGKRRESTGNTVGSRVAVFVVCLNVVCVAQDPHSGRNGSGNSHSDGNHDPVHDIRLLPLLVRRSPLGSGRISDQKCKRGDFYIPGKLNYNHSSTLLNDNYTSRPTSSAKG